MKKYGISVVTVSLRASLSHRVRGGLSPCDGCVCKLRLCQPADDDILGARSVPEVVGTGNIQSCTTSAQYCQDREHSLTAAEDRACSPQGRHNGLSQRASCAPGDLRDVGQPVLIPAAWARNRTFWSAQTGRWKRTFGSSCHGAGRAMSRTKAKRETSAEELLAI